MQPNQMAKNDDVLRANNFMAALRQVQERKEQNNFDPRVDQQAKEILSAPRDPIQRPPAAVRIRQNQVLQEHIVEKAQQQMKKGAMDEQMALELKILGMLNAELKFHPNGELS